MTDCSCEGFSSAVKAGQLAGWRGRCVCFSPEAADRQTDRQTVQELVSSCLTSASSFIRLRLLRSSQDLPPRRRREPGGGESHSERLEARRQASAADKTKKTHFPYVPTCISKPPPLEVFQGNNGIHARAAALLAALREVQERPDKSEPAELIDLLDQNIGCCVSHSLIPPAPGGRGGRKVKRG